MVPDILVQTTVVDVATESLQVLFSLEAPRSTHRPRVKFRGVFSHGQEVVTLTQAYSCIV